jgi:hypothetical protein
MADLNQPANTENWLEEPRKLPSLLNVLTILTFIGCGLAIVGGITGYFTAASTYDKQVQLQDKMDQMPDFVKNLAGPDPVGNARKQLENRIPITLLTLVAGALCLYGAIQMRKLKKTGFPIYIVGELLPFLTIIIFIGSGLITSVTGIISLLISAVFIILYATQLKYLSQ